MTNFVFLATVDQFGIRYANTMGEWSKTILDASAIPKADAIGFALRHPSFNFILYKTHCELLDKLCNSHR